MAAVSTPTNIFCCKLERSEKILASIIFTRTMAAYRIALLAILVVHTMAQRPSFAGLSPIGYPQLESNSLISNRFGEDVPGPIEAKGDGNLINRLSQMPVEKQPFWYLNWQKYDELRKQPQVWPQKPLDFVGVKA